MIKEINIPEQVVKLLADEICSQLEDMQSETFIVGYKDYGILMEMYLNAMRLPLFRDLMTRGVRK